MRPEAGRPLAPQSPRQPVAPGSAPLWKRLPKWLYYCAVILSIAITLLTSYPWLHIEKDSSLNTTNPFSQYFVIVNGGYIPLTGLDAECGFSTELKSKASGEISDGHDIWRGFAHSLPKDGRATIPCRPIWSGKDIHSPDGAIFEIKITYAYYHFNLGFLRRSQDFHFTSIAGSDGSRHWQYQQ
jgi:hypothetical protein